MAFGDVVINRIFLKHFFASHTLDEFFILEFVEHVHVSHVFFRVVDVFCRVVLEGLVTIGMLALDDRFRVDIRDVVL